MPNIVKAYGVHLTDDVVKIKDITLHRLPKKKARPRHAPEPCGEGMLPAHEEEPAAFAPFDAQENGQPLPTMLEEEAYEDEPASDGGYGEHAREEIIRSAMAEAGRILEGAIHDGEAKRAEILSGVQAEADELRRQAAEQGRVEALQMTMNETKDIAAQIEHMLAVFEGERASFEFEYEEQLRWLACEIASKVLAKKIEKDDAEMLEMVDKAVQSVHNESWVRVEVSGKMSHLIEQLLSLYKNDEKISVQPVNTDPGTVLVETPSGVIDASLKIQLENLRDYFAKFGDEREG